MLTYRLPVQWIRPVETVSTIFKCSTWSYETLKEPFPLRIRQRWWTDEQNFSESMFLIKSKIKPMLVNILMVLCLPAISHFWNLVNLVELHFLSNEIDNVFSEGRFHIERVVSHGDEKKIFCPPKSSEAKKSKGSVIRYMVPFKKTKKRERWHFAANILENQQKEAE